MKYLVRISELRYGEVEVEAKSEEEAKELASGMSVNYYDSEITDMTAEPMHISNYEKCKGCAYYFGEIDNCMYGEPDVSSDAPKKCKEGTDGQD